eukprot:COSAG06_NODE_53022_length_302_cov_1.014778_1_plen_37_part_10
MGLAAGLVARLMLQWSRLLGSRAAKMLRVGRLLVQAR